MSGPWLGVDLRDALRHLRREDASLLLLRAAVGFSYEELAAVTRQSVPAVRSRLYRARRELAERLGEDASRATI